MKNNFVHIAHLKGGILNLYPSNLSSYEGSATFFYSYVLVFLLHSCAVEYITFLFF